MVVVEARLVLPLVVAEVDRYEVDQLEVPLDLIEEPEAEERLVQVVQEPDLAA